MATKFSEFTAADMRAAMIDSQLRTNDVIDAAVVGAPGFEGGAHGALGGGGLHGQCPALKETQGRPKFP